MSYPEAIINISQAGDNTVVAGIPGTQIFVFRIFLTTNTSVVLTPKDGPSTALTGPMMVGGFVLDFDGLPWFTTSPGNDFILNLASATQVSGRLYYFQG